MSDAIDEAVFNRRDISAFEDPSQSTEADRRSLWRVQDPVRVR